MSVRTRGEGFQADFAHNGSRYRAQFPTHQEALTWEADTRAALVSGRPLPMAPAGVTSAMTWQELRKRTVAEYWTGTKSGHWAARTSQEAVDFFGANTQIATTRGRQINDYTVYLRDQKGVGSSTVNRYLAAVSKMLSHAKDIEAISDKPSIKRQKEGEARERFLTPREAQALIDTFRKWGLEEDAALTEFLLDTGARISEALSTRARDLGGLGKDIDRVTLGAGETGSKNGLQRIIPLTKRLRERLPPMVLGRAGTTEKVFENIIKATYTGRFQRVRDHLGLGDDVVIHTLRHTCASWLAQRGVELLRIKDWMGHKSIQTTLRYAKLAPSALFEAVEVLDREYKEAA